MALKLTCQSLKNLDSVSEKLLKHFPQKRIFALYGELGAGKTTLIQTLCKKLGVIDYVSSPSFTIVNEYTTKDGTIIYHFDLYRIKNQQEIYDIGYEDYVYPTEKQRSYCFIEWAEKIKNLLPKEIVNVHITVKGKMRIIVAD